MAAAAARFLPGNRLSGLVVGTHCPIPLPGGLEWMPSSHPVPDVRSVQAGARALALAKATAERDLLLVLLSGGASSLLALPRPGLTLADKQETTRLLLLAGADIQALNTVRKHLSAIKGGQLAAAARGRTLALAVSDVVSNDLSVIGSGPTVPDPGTFGDALQVLRAHGGLDRFPPAVRSLLAAGERGEVPETPKAGEAWQARSETRLIGSRQDALNGAAARAAQLGYHVVVLPGAVVGEARQAGERLARLLLDQTGSSGTATRPDPRPLCILAAGETTVTVKGGGRGGRNQELALAAACELERCQVPCAVLSAGTDGIDGPTDAAGAIADVNTLERAAARGLPHPVSYLENNDAYAFFEALSDLVLVGPTDTNVGDIQIMVAAGDRQP